MKWLKRLCLLLAVVVCLAACGSNGVQVREENTTTDFDLSAAREMVAVYEGPVAWLSTQSSITREKLEELKTLAAGPYGYESVDLHAGFIDGALIGDEKVTEFPIRLEGGFKPTIYHEGIEVLSAEETRTVFTYTEKGKEPWQEERTDLVIRLGYTGEEPLLQDWSLEYHFRDLSGEGNWNFVTYNGSYNIGGEDVNANLLPLKEIPEY